MKQPVSASKQSPSPKPEQKSYRPIKVTKLHRTSRSDSHVDYSIHGEECRSKNDIWECRKYLSYHPFNTEQLSDVWHQVENSEKWNEILMSDGIQKKLREGLEARTKRRKEKMKSRPSLRGSVVRVLFGWEDGSVSINTRKAEGDISELSALLNGALKNKKPLSTRYMLEPGIDLRVGMKELAWLDDSYALKVERCKTNDILIGHHVNGVHKKNIKLKNRERPSFKIGEYSVKITMSYCGRQNYVSLIVDSPVK